VLQARRFSRRSGAVELLELAATLASQAAGPAELRRVLELRPEVTWLDPQHTWLTVAAEGGRFPRALRKVLALSPALTIAEIDEGLRRWVRPILLPRRVLRELCASLDWLAFDRDGDSVSTAVPLDRLRCLSPLERDLVALFEEAGPVVDFRRATRLAQAAGLNRTSVGIYLSRSPLLTTVGRRRYALRRQAA
jgi:hypothetical protein